MEPKVTLYDMQRSLHRAKPTVGPDDLTKLEEWSEQFGQEE